MTSGKLKISFQGAKGSHSQLAIDAFFKNLKFVQPQHPCFPKQKNEPPSYEALGFETVKDVFSKLREVDYALLPVENTYSGTFTQIYDLLLAHCSQVHVVGEWVMHEENALLVYGDDVKDLSDIEEVYSHSHVLEQCSNVLDEIKKKAGKLITHALEDTAHSAMFIKQKQLKKAACLAHPSAASTYGLRILKTGVENDLKSATRYLLLANKPLTSEQLSFVSQMGSNKTSLAMVLKNQPGMLFKSIGCFAMRDLNITKLESRPSPRAYSSLTTSQSPWEYINYVDVEGGTNEDKVRNALNNLQEFATEIKVLGSYPRFTGTYEPTSPIGGAYGM